MHRFFLEITKLREEINEMKDGLFFARNYRGTDLLAKLGPERSVFLIVRSDMNIQAKVPESSRLILVGMRFSLFTAPAKDLLESDFLNSRRNTEGVF